MAKGSLQFAGPGARPPAGHGGEAHGADQSLTLEGRSKSVASTCRHFGHRSWTRLR